MYFSAYDFTCKIIEMKSTLIPVSADYIIFAKFAALANQVSSVTCKNYNLSSMSTSYISLQHACMSMFVQLDLL